MDSLHTQHKGLASSVSAVPREHVFDNAVRNVPEKYMGTTADMRDMSVLGKKQVLRVNSCLQAY